MDPPLTGTRVVALEQAVSMPFASWWLAEMGADVIKIERPGTGDVLRGWDDAVRGLSSGYVWVNSNKRDITVDISQPEGRSIVHRLVADADVFLENFAPGVAERHELGPDRLRAGNERLIYCSLSGYGQDGPYRDVKAYDLLIQGESGILLSNGYPDAPAKVGMPITDLMGGATVAFGIACALLERERTGAGQVMDVGMLEATVPWLGYFPLHWRYQASEPPRTGMRHQYLTPYGPFRASDGRYVNLVVASARDWKAFVEDVAARPEWLDDPRLADIASRRANRALVDSLVEGVIATEPSPVWLERLRAAGLPHGVVRTMAEVVDHPQLEHMDMWVEATSPVGDLRIGRFPLSPADRARHIPALGEHTREILLEAGYDADDIAGLRSRGVI